MSHPSPNPPPLSPPRAASLCKQKTWSPDMYREEAWLRQKDRRTRRSRSVTDEDVDEIKACIELGFGFDSPEMDQRLSDTFPAYGLYYTVNKHYNDTVLKHPPPSPPEFDAMSPLGSPHTIFGPGDTPQSVKTRLRQWAQVVACARVDPFKFPAVSEKKGILGCPHKFASSRSGSRQRLLVPQFPDLKSSHVATAFDRVEKVERLVVDGGSFHFRWSPLGSTTALDGELAAERWKRRIHRSRRW